MTAFPPPASLGRRLSAILIACLTALSCAESSPAPGERGPAALIPIHAIADERDLVSLLPDSVDSILTVDLARLRGSAFARPLLTAATNEDRAARGARGFDEIADVDAWAFARMATPGGDRATVELARGRFDRARVTAAFSARWPQSRATQFGRLPGVTEANLAVMFFSPRAVAFGPSWALRVIAGVLEGRTASARALPWLAEVSKALARGRAPFRDVDADRGRVRNSGEEGIPGSAALAPAVELALRATASTRSELATAFGVDVPIDHVGARIDVGQAARGLLIATATSPEAAQLLAEQMREGMESLRARPSVRAMGLGRMLARGDVAAKGAKVALALAITGAEREVVANKLATFASLLARGARAAADGAPARDPARPALEPESPREQSAPGKR
jgi:hypothetical protein